MCINSDLLLAVCVCVCVCVCDIIIRKTFKIHINYIFSSQALIERDFVLIHT